MNDASGRAQSSAMATVKFLERADGKRRVVVVRRASDWFTFIEQVGYDVDIVGIEAAERRRWASLPSGGGIYGTAAEAEREAKAAIGWLRDEPTT